MAAISPIHAMGWSCLTCLTPSPAVLSSNQILPVSITTVKLSSTSTYTPIFMETVALRVCVCVGVGVVMCAFVCVCVERRGGQLFTHCGSTHVSN